MQKASTSAEMAKKTKRKRLSADQRRRVILAAAESVFAERGFHSASMEDIAELAGVSKPVVYDHFTSKDELFRCLLVSIREELLRQGRDALVNEASPEARMKKGVESFFAFVEARPQAARVMFVMSRQHAETADLAAEIQRQATLALAGMLASVIGPQAEWRTVAMAEFLKRGLHAMAEWWFTHPEVSKNDLVEIVMSIAWQGLRSHARAQD